MENNKLISIITTSYNYSEYISETIKSVLAQTYSDWELIIVDDKSTDNSIEVIKSFCDDSRIKLICHDKNKGLQESIKTALMYVKGEWITFLESDDFLTTNSLEERAKHFDKANFIFNGVNLIGENDWINGIKPQVLRTEKTLLKKTYPTNMLKDFEVKNPILTLSSVIFKKELLKENLLNSPSDALFDWWFYIHLAKENEFYYVPQKLTNWRVHSSSYIKQPNRPRFCMVNLLAYIDLFKQDKSFDLLFILINCAIKTGFARINVYFISFIRKIKSIFGLKNKKSPLFD